MNKLESKINGKGTVRLKKGFTLFILNEDMKDLIIIIKSSEYLGELIDGVTEKVKHAIISILISLGAWLVQPVLSSVVRSISGRGFRGGGRGYMNKTF